MGMMVSADCMQLRTELLFNPLTISPHCSQVSVCISQAFSRGELHLGRKTHLQSYCILFHINLGIILLRHTANVRL